MGMEGPAGPIDIGKESVASPSPKGSQACAYRVGTPDVLWT
jgi:hypothetical protein